MASLTDIRTVTFDCYGTLVDSGATTAAFIYDLVLRNSDPKLESGRALAAPLHEINFELTNGPYMSYRNVLHEGLRRYVAQRGYPWNPEDAEAYVRAVGSAQPFPDTRPALQLAREAGLRLVIISNTDHDIIEHSLRQLELPFDDVIIAEDCQAYKPDLRVFEYALARLDENPQHILHVAFGYRYDIGAAQQLGMHTAWVNRRAEPIPGQAEPDFMWRDLWGLAEIAGADIPVP